MNKRKYKSLWRLGLCLLLGLMSLSLGVTGKDEARALSLAAPAASSAAIDAPGHHFGFSQASVLAQTTSQQTILAAPSPVLTGNGPPCTTVVGQTCIITGQVNGAWVKTGPAAGPSPNRFTLNATVPSGALIPQSDPTLFLPTTAGMEQHDCSAPTAVGTNVTCTGTSTTDIVQARPFTVRFHGTAGLIDVTNTSTIGYTAGGSCPSVPPVVVNTVDDGHNRLAVTVSSNTAAGVQSNGVFRLAFDPAQPSDNRQIDIGSLIGQTGAFTADIAPAQESVTFFARPLVSGQPVTVGFTAYHACGPWHSLAGSGHFTPLLSSATPAADVVAATANNKVFLPGSEPNAIAPAVEQPFSTAPSAPVLNTAPAPVSAPPAVSVPPVVGAPPAVSVPPAVSGTGAGSIAPAPGAQSVVPPFGAQPLVYPPFAQPLLPFGAPGGYPMVAPPAPFSAPAAIQPPAMAPNPLVLPDGSAPVAAPPALAPSAPAAASPESVSPPPAGPATDDTIAPPAVVWPADVSAASAPTDLPAVQPDPASSDASGAPDDSDSVTPPFAQ